MAECRECRKDVDALMHERPGEAIWTIVVRPGDERTFCNRCELEYRQERAAQRNPLKSTPAAGTHTVTPMLAGIRNVSPSRAMNASPASSRDLAEGDLFTGGAE